MFSFRRNYQAAFHTTCPMSHSHHRAEDFQLLHALANTIFSGCRFSVLTFIKNHPYEYGAAAQVVLICISQVTSNLNIMTLFYLFIFIWVLRIEPKTLQEQVLITLNYLSSPICLLFCHVVCVCVVCVGSASAHMCMCLRRPSIDRCQMSLLVALHHIH